jgi:hypothetical protein
MSTGMKNMTTQIVNERKVHNPLIYWAIFLALWVIKPITQHLFAHPEWIQIISVVALGIACYPIRHKLVRNFALYWIGVFALAVGWAYSHRIWQVLRHMRY